MQLLDAYLKTIARFLPAADRDDIVRELSENLRSQIEDRESEIGRSLSEAELKALFDGFGSPLEVAGRYRQTNGIVAFGPVLVGPVLFPFYARILGLVLGLTASAILVIGAAMRTPTADLSRALLIHLSIQFGIVTLIFSIAQISLARRPRVFDVSYPLWYVTPPDAADTPRIPRLESLSQIVMLAILLAWLPALRGFGRTAMAEAGLTPAPVWGDIYVALACLWGFGIVRAAVALARPDLTRFWSVARSVGDVAWLGMLTALLWAGRLVAPLASSASPAFAGRVADAVNHWGVIALLVIALASAVNLVLGLRRSITGKGVVRCIVLAAGLLAAVDANAQTKGPTVAAVPADEEIRKALAEQVDANHLAIGMVVGVVSPSGRRIVAYGRLSREDARTPDGDTVFGIGSVTKTFTGLLLADMVQRHEVALDDPLGRYLPAGVKVPSRSSRQITLADLALQSSGLPFWPTGVPEGDDGAIAMSKYTLPQLYEFLGSYELTRDIGSKWEYSNLGYGLLGLALARRANTDYAHLVRARITARLGMTSTQVALSPAMKTRLAPGHDTGLRPAERWDVPVFVAAGGLHSTANDLLTLLEGFGSPRCPLASAMAGMTARRQSARDFEQALGWWVMFAGSGDPGILTHPGATLGHSAVLAYDPRTRVGVVVLANGVGADVGSVAWHILRPAIWPWSVKAKPKPKNEVAIDAVLLQRYAGQYRATPESAITIVWRDGALFLVGPGTPPEGLRLRAESETGFFVAGIDLQIRFTTREGGEVTALVLSFGGIDTRMTRVPE